MGFVGLRFTLAAVIFLPLSFHSIKLLSNTQRLKASAVGLAYILTMILWISGLIYSEDLGEGAFIYSLSMLIAPLMSWVLFKHQPKKAFWFALPIAALGLYFLSIKQGFIHLSLSNILFLLGSISAALYFVLNNQFAKEIDSLSLTTIQLAIVGISAGIYSLIFEKWHFPIPTETWYWFLGSVILTTNIRVLLQTIAQRRCHVNTAAIIMLLEPVWTLLLGWFVLNEEIFFTKIIGCVLIFSAIFIYRLKRK